MSSALGKQDPRPYHVTQAFQVEDKSDELPPKEAFSYRSIVGTCLLFSKRSTRSALHGEGVEWGHVKALLTPHCND